MTTRPASPQAFAISPDGALLASVDGAEVLVWGADRGEPLWKALGEARYTDLAVSSAGVWIVDEGGALEQRRLVDGALVHRQVLCEDAVRVVVAHRDAVVLADDATIVFSRAGTEIARAEHHGITAMATNGEQVAVVDAPGSLTVYALDEPRALGRLALGGAASALLWHPHGYWLAAVARHLRPVAVDAATLFPAHGLGERDVLRGCLSVGDTMLVLQTDLQRIEVLSWPELSSMGTVRLGRDIIGLAPGRRGAVWLGLRHGDVQGIDLLSGTIEVTAPHEGRARVPWGVDARLESARIRGLHATVQAGGEPIAIFVPPTEDDGPPRWVYVVLRVLGISLVVGFVAVVIWVLMVWLG